MTQNESNSLPLPKIRNTSLVSGPATHQKRGPLPDLLVGNASAADHAPPDGREFFGIDAPLRYLTPLVGKGEPKVSSRRRD